MPPRPRGAPPGGPSRGNPRFNPAFGAGRGGGINQSNQLCGFFMRGSCKYGTTCRNSHTLTQPAGNVAGNIQSPAPNFPGLSNDDFSKVELNQTPGKTFHSLKPYVEDSFRFKTPDQVYRFLSNVCSANSQNPSWTAKDGQLHLHQLVEGNGIQRLADAIRFPKNINRAWSFQRGYIPIFTYLISDWVVKSTMNSDVNALYGLVHHNFQVIRDTVETNMRRLMAARSFRDGSQAVSGKQVFKVLFGTLFEYLTRFKDAPVTNPGVREFTEQIATWFDEWLVALDSSPRFQDECTTYATDKREFIIENLRRDKERILRIIHRGQTVITNNEVNMSHELLSGVEPGLLAAFERNFDYDGPGELCETGPRHDNDFVEIETIRVPPTRDELLCEDDPYLPPNFFEAPHFHDPRSIERLLDIQFRLLREELTSPIRLAVQLINEDMKKAKSGNTTLSKLLTAKGGRYASPEKSRESVIFSVFTGVTFKPLALSNRGISAGIEFDTPPGKARSDRPGVRAEYWEQVSKKRLMQDGLVALIWRDHVGKVDIYVGTVASSGRDLVDGSKAPHGKERASIRVSFFDATTNLRIVQALQNRRTSSDTRLLIEAPVFYEAYRPFLEALKREPELLPFGDYLKLQSKDELSRTTINPPLYSHTPGFSFELKDLFKPEAGVQSFKLNTRDPVSVANARARLARTSRLDPSQADAVVDSLTREVALIQGPPGTGKSYTGLELIRVLVKNQIGPILLVAFTNHALDHMLNGILNAEISTKIVRLGRFSKDERLSKYSLDTIEKAEGRSRLGRSEKSAYREMKILESQMKELMTDISSHRVPTSHVERHIASAYPHHHGELFRHVPTWIDAIIPKPGEDWETAGESPQQDQSIIEFWLKCRDLQFLNTREKKGAAEATTSNNAFNAFSESNTADGDAPITRESFLLSFMREHGLQSIPKVPNTTRPLDALLDNPRVWRMSRGERATLYEAWSIEASDLTHTGQIENFEKFRQSHVDVSGHHKEITEQLKAEILSRSEIVGCTTTGAAKVISMLSGMGPKVMIVEEAGQVLESHILASLVGSVEHVILIGDPLQLRPNINSYKLATDNPHTGKIYRFDQSLMERLSSSGFPMSQIDVQRRMRPEISSLIRNTLYPNLKDNDRVLSYPNVRGMHKNMYFVSHTHKEVGGGEDAVSKHNSFEVDMIYDLVVHLLKQGCYNTPGNIVILAAYLGQIPKLRQRLQEIVTIVIDERDAELLEQRTMDQEETATVQQVQLSQQVTIRTLDNFQGEEGEVIILSLIRNSGAPFNKETSLEHVKGRAPIGFLKSLNRTNVGLSRAKHGLYIFGNAPELAQGSQMWSDVLKELNSSECLGPKLPIACHRHPDYIQWIDRPGVIPTVSPKGGCLQPCGGALSCGHVCPSMCHADDPNHISTKCQQACLRLCSRSHPCDRQCWECSTTLSNCRFPITDLQLPCGHLHPPIQCHRVTTPEKMKCSTRVVKQLPSCGHNATMPCHQDPASFQCQEPVSKELPHCQHRSVLPCSMPPATHLCQEQVEKEFPSCKHHTQMACHQDPSEVLCSQRVEKKLACDHIVTVPCHQDISKRKCRIEVEKRLPGCSHSAKMPCHQNPTTFACREPVIKSLPVCGHRAQMLCSEDSKAYACREYITKSVPVCGHRAQMLCSQDSKIYACLVPVEKQFSNCSHRKQLICHQLRDPTTNLCQERLEKELTCRHRVTMHCYEDPTEYQCQKRVERQLFCGHRATMPCHRITSDHKCQQRVQKQLPFCEHRASMLCHQAPETHHCSKACGGDLACCSGACSAQCGTCHQLNPGETGSGARTRHAKHGCQRRIVCGHVCNVACTEGHVCSGLCKARCQQACKHSNCDKQCSTPCRPCEKSCAWKCVHAECMSPCGMACTRLPCDKKCPNILSCGHPCPSVCGEPCERQTCKTCSEEDTLASIVDLLGRVHLRDLGDNATLDSMTITLPCRHVFTVKALDSITRIRDFYERGDRGEWTKAIMPVASAVRNRPTCPHCGGGVDSLRYGRILKNFNHSILQHNVARSLSGQLSEAERLLSEVRDELSDSVAEAVRSYGTARLPSGATHRTLLERVNGTLAADQGFPTNLDMVGNLSKFHGFPPRYTKAWRKAVGDIMEPYKIACRVARESDPSAQACEGLLARLYQAELNKSGGSTALTTDPEQQRLQHLASKVAHTRIGHLRPRANDRFTVEAFWVTIEILLLLGLAVSKACEEIMQETLPGANITHWENVAEFLLLRALADAETAHRLADQSRSRNKAILCRLLILQIQYEHTAHRCRAAARNGSLSRRETRDEFIGICARTIQQLRGLQTSVPQDYQARLQRGLLAGVTATKVEWVRVNFVHPLQKLLDAWNNLTRIIEIEIPEQRREQASDRQLVSWEPLVQKYAVLKRVSHTGHFHQCPRGHPYTQGECTIVLGTTWCPECGIAVGNVD
ncbi:NFX1-type zinc finger protein [Rhizoctonia solani 123E]|uniref:NFX1-type zinc finger protein n=1 Tax=Rhizoctonia solani 123E TaxID=1423351 RepID=A0A074RQU2_9AGAM|nr:NFX1-type zinc finger protein [Rhizoctonia solani 123E]